ncbi:MAG: hypothetical protein J6Y91_06330, partial [Alphaproteobacteria bacterium]|nr:hypothetical protein [Alphaproteobacteria bacterium]
MSNIVVPNFHRDADFQDWVASLSEKEIQTWRTKDWNAMFEKLEHYVDNNRMLRLKCRFHNFFNNSKRYMPVAVFMSRDSRNVAALTKLYKNFRLEPAQFDIIRRTARQAGQFLAMKSDVHLEKIALMSHIRSHAEYEKVAQLASDIVLQQSEYAPQYKERMAVKSEFAEKQKFGGVAHLRDSRYPLEIIQPTIYYGFGGDSFAELMFHESAHAYLQTGTAMQEKLADRGIYPLAEMDRDFYRLMRYNYTFYLPSEGVVKSLRNYFKRDNGLQKYDDAAMFMKGYQRQPVEKYSYIYGMEAERAYRRDKKQLSERGALSMLQVLGVTCGYPYDVT